MYKREIMYYSRSDLTTYMESPFASWMDRLAQEHSDLTSEKGPSDEFMGLLQRKGYAHEDALEIKFIADGRTLVKIEGNNNEKHIKTLEAMKEGVEVIVQARLELEQFAGFSDFLVKVIHESGQTPILQIPPKHFVKY